MKNKVVFFDIDYTLFDKDLFLEALFKNLGETLDVDLKTITKVGENAYNENILKFSHFEPKDFALMVAKKLEREDALKNIEEIVLEKYNFPDCLYKESIDTLKEVSRIATIGIFSKGHTVFQRNKILKIKHLLYERHVHISVDKKATLLKIIKEYKNKQLYFIDDALDILFEAWKLRKNVITVWVKRGIYAKNQKPIKNFKPDAIIESLGELISIINYQFIK